MLPAATTNNLKPIAFADIDGWTDDDHAAAFAAFRRGAAALDDHPPRQRGLGLDAVRLAGLLAEAGLEASANNPGEARAFFEARFTPHQVEEKGSGVFTGYYEPEIDASPESTKNFTVPFYRRPDDLVEIEPGSRSPPLDPTYRFARLGPDGYAEYADRRAIMAGALNGRGLELAYVADPVDAFFVHIQGAARLRYRDGRIRRITYAAKSGHPYTPIGRVLRARGALRQGEVTMQSIRLWLAAHPAERDAVLSENRSFIFFREAPVEDPDLGPVAAAKVPLTPGRSLAVDRLLHSFHAPVWIDTRHAHGDPIRRLMVAQDTGSAIVGAARGDIFFGSGDRAGEAAGTMNGRGRFILLVPGGTRP